jgi:hypothetical protein
LTVVVFSPPPLLVILSVCLSPGLPPALVNVRVVVLSEPDLVVVTSPVVGEVLLPLLSCSFSSREAELLLSSLVLSVPELVVSVSETE